MSNTNMPQQRYFKTSGASRYCSVSEKRLEKLRCSGGGPRYFKRGRSVFYCIEDLDAWMQAGAQSSTSDLVAA